MLAPGCARHYHRCVAVVRWIARMLRTPGGCFLISNSLSSAFERHTLLNIQTNRRGPIHFLVCPNDAWPSAHPERNLFGVDEFRRSCQCRRLNRSCPRQSNSRPASFASSTRMPFLIRTFAGNEWIGQIPVIETSTSPSFRVVERGIEFSPSSDTVRRTG